MGKIVFVSPSPLSSLDQKNHSIRPSFLLEGQCIVSEAQLRFALEGRRASKVCGLAQGTFRIGCHSFLNREWNPRVRVRGKVRTRFNSPWRSSIIAILSLMNQNFKHNAMHIRCCRVKSPRGGICRASAWHDEFSHLKDRIDAEPPLFPSIKPKQSIRFTIVRHGQSTWNAASRIQGSSDLSELTTKGKAQAESSREMTENMHFDLMFASTLTRARQTADILVNERGIRRYDMAILREIDLYSFQGLEKKEVKERFPVQHKLWKEQPELFEIDGHAPCRELWHRGGLAWHQMIKQIEEGEGQNTQDLSILVVAHNNMNQALIATALGFPCTYFRRLVQSNAAVSSLLVRPASSSQGQKVVLECLNKTSAKRSGGIFEHDEGVSRIIIVTVTSNTSHVDKIRCLLSSKIIDQRISLFVDPSCSESQLLSQGLIEDTHGQLQASDPPPNQLWLHLKAHASHSSLTVLIASPVTASSIICQALDLPDTDDQRSSILTSPGGLSILELEDGKKTIAYCLNSTSHL